MEGTQGSSTRRRRPQPTERSFPIRYTPESRGEIDLTIISSHVDTYARGRLVPGRNGSFRVVIPAYFTTTAEAELRHILAIYRFEVIAKVPRYRLKKSIPS